MKARNGIKTAIAALAASMFAACTPKPQAVCERIMELREADRPSTDPVRHANRLAECIGRMEAARTAAPDAYKTAAKCIMTLHGAGQRHAMELCAVPLMQYLAPGRASAMGPRPMPESPAVRPVMDPAMDPRTAEPCIAECRASGAQVATPAYTVCFNTCTARRAAQINAAIH